ncbi:uncharacterized protein LOC135164885 [Diachasmimorpha longicaudata]|uniref:uncharacterized protein LOC135164885 n=1 Tax=Diachasmimorpha longicaudata TaxID=58733 RepID=UPI0030B89D2C
MQTIVYRILISILLITTIACTKPNLKSASIPEKPEKLSSKNRHGRTTFVKAIVSNPNLSPTHILAEKLAKEALRSTRTQQTLKKLTEIRVPVDKRSIERNDHQRHHHKKRKRKKHRHRSGDRHHHHHHRNARRRRLGTQVSGNLDGTNGRADLTPKKIQVKRNDIDCIITRLTFFNPMEQPLPISDTFHPDQNYVRISRQVSNQLGKSSVRNRQGRVSNDFDKNSGFNQDMYLHPGPSINPGSQFSNIDVNSLMYPRNYNQLQFPMFANGFYPPERQPNYFPQIEAGQKGFPVSTRAARVTKHDATNGNSTTNCTTSNSEISSGGRKVEEQGNNVEHNVLPASSHPGEALASQSQVNVTGVETKQVANEILNEIIEELEDLKVDHNMNNPREGLPCKVTGSWTTTQAGVDLKITVINQTLVVTLEKMNPVMKLHNGILNTTWNVTGHVPVKRGAPFAIVATNVYVKSLATFIGACRICQGVDTIEGVWSVIKEPRGCRDLQASTSAYNDVFRRVIPTPKTKKKKNVTTR